MPPPGPLVLAGLGAVGEDPHPTQVVRPVRELSLFDQDQPRARPSRPARPASPGSPRRSRSAAPFLLGAVITVLIAAAAFVLARPSVGPTVTVPLLVGQSRSNAQQTALDKNLLVDSTYRTSDDPRGTVIAQDPQPGGFLAERTSVHLVLSKGPKPVQLPGARGHDPGGRDARRSQAQFAVQVVNTARRQGAEGHRHHVGPAGLGAARLHRHSSIVSSGPPLVVVPDVVGSRATTRPSPRLKRAAASARRASDEFNDTVPVGQVIGTDPRGGQAGAEGLARSRSW